MIRALERRVFSERGPVPRPLNVGTGLAVMLLCLQSEQSIVAPTDDAAETVFTVVAGRGAIREGGEEHEVEEGDVVHVLPGATKSLHARGEQFAVLGVMRMAAGRMAGRGKEADDVD